MALIKTKGLVVKEVPLNDTDKMLTLITSDLGKVSVSARNARKNGSRAAYGTQILTYGEYVLFKGKGSLYLNSCDVLANYYTLAGDLTCFTHAAHMLDMACDAANDSASSGQILIAVLYGLRALQKGRNPQLVSAAFSLKLMQLTGYPPHTTSCTICDRQDIDEIHFSFKNRGFICENCARRDPEAIAIDIGTAKAILYVLCAENGGIYNFELSDNILDAFSGLAFRYISEQLDKNYRRLDFLKGI